MDDENEQLDEMQEQNENRLAEKSGKQAMKKQQKKNKRKQTIKTIWQKIPLKVKLIMLAFCAIAIGIILLSAAVLYLLEEEEKARQAYEEQLNEAIRTTNLQTYLRQFSHSSEAPQSADGQFYKLYGDGSGWPTIGNADLQWKSHEDKFACSGEVRQGDSQQTVENVQDFINDFLTKGSKSTYSDEEIDEMDLYIEKELVDSIGSETAESYYQSVKTATSGLELSEQQLFALTAISYNFGHLPTRNGYTFKEVYEEGAGRYSINSWQHNRYIWDNWWSYLGGGQPGHIPARDAAFETYVKGVFDFSDSDAGEVFSRKYYIYYTQEQLDRFDYAPDKPVTRTSSNEREILTYEEKSIFGVGAGNILEAAERIHSVYETEKWTYSVGSDLYFGNINLSLNNPNKVTCCATFVSATLYLSGLVSEEEINSISYNSSTAIYRYLKTLDGRFMEIESFEDLEPGDIVFMTSEDVPDGIGHTQIYAGNNTWYNAGSTTAIQRASPYTSGANYTMPRFVTAMRPL